VAAGEPDVDVLVVGAGPTGLTLAALLAQSGTRSRLVDRQLDRVHESRALAVQPRTLEVLTGLGVADTLVERGNRAVRLQLHFGRRVVPVRLFDIGVDDTEFPYLLFVSQAETEQILGEHIVSRGGTLERGVELTELVQTAESVSCHLLHHNGREEVVSARYVVGCDGAHSSVREQAGIAFEGRAYPQTFVLADLEADGIEPGFAHAFVSRRGILFFFPLEEPATWRMLAMRPRTDRTPVEQPVTLDEVQALADAYAAIPMRMRDPVWMTNFRLHNRGAAHYRLDRVFLAGDAAHVHSPAGAQGMNTGIQDSVNLGWKLALVAAGIAEPGLLDSYEPERAPVGRMVLRFTDRAFTIATSRNPAVRFARTELLPRLAPLALRVRAGRTYGFRTVSQLGIRYRNSPLSVEGPNALRRGPRAGDRLPDAPVSYAGRVGTLHRALAAQGFHLLLCGPAVFWPAGAVADAVDGYGHLVTVHYLARDGGPDVLIDDSGAALSRLGVTGSQATVLYLIRPDGHVAYRAGVDRDDVDLSGLTGLRAYLARWLLPQPR
jgi:2-polyprenyl-6-methoxyphenol hydroxylase-like FAD-dependent oxidoreductase